MPKPVHILVISALVLFGGMAFFALKDPGTSAYNCDFAQNPAVDDEGNQQYYDTCIWAETPYKVWWFGSPRPTALAATSQALDVQIEDSCARISQFSTSNQPNAVASANADILARPSPSNYDPYRVKKVVEGQTLQVVARIEIPANYPIWYLLQLPDGTCGWMVSISVSLNVPETEIPWYPQ